MKKYILFIVTLALLFSEAIISIDPIPVFLFYSALIIGCLILLAREEKMDSRGKLITVFLILLVVRIIEMFIPFSYVYRAIIIYLLLFFLVVFYSLKFKTYFGNTKRGLIMLPLTILLGIAIGFIGNKLFILTKHPELLFLLPIIAFTEEGFFRGLMQNLLWDNYGTTISIVFTSLLYGIFSLGFGLGFAVFMFFVNLILCYVYNRKGNIWLTMSINILMNLILFL